MHRWRLLSFAVSLLFLAGTLHIARPSTAQTADCQAVLQSLWTAASTACIGKPPGFLCNGGATPTAEPTGPVANALASVGALVETGFIDSVRTPPITVESNTAGIAWLRLDVPLQLTGLMVGDVALRDLAPPDFPAWQSILVQTGSEPASCAAAPASSFIVQTPRGLVSRVVINGASLTVNGTVLVRTQGSSTLYVGLSGLASLIAFGQEQPFRNGQMVTVPAQADNLAIPAGTPSIPVPFDGTLVRNLPVALFDRPLVLPQPGVVSTQGPVNLRVQPSTDAGIILQVPSGEALSVLGRDPSGAWFHVRRDTGETGWMLAELLAQNVGMIEAAYEATPLPPQRLGELGTRGRVLAPAGVSLRIGPDPGFPALVALTDGTLVNLVARSPYSPWVKVEVGGTVGWLALIVLETQAYIDALPVDYTAPPQPTPTTVPGSFGNAFPNPNAPENP